MTFFACTSQGLFSLYSLFVFVGLYFFQLKIQAQGEQYRKLENFKLWHCFLAVHKVYCPFQMPTNIHNRQFTEKDWEVKSKQILKKLSEPKQIVGQKSWILRHLVNAMEGKATMLHCCMHNECGSIGEEVDRTWNGEKVLLVFLGPLSFIRKLWSSSPSL